VPVDGSGLTSDKHRRPGRNRSKEEESTVSENTKISLLLIETDQAAMDICRKIIGRKFPELIVHCSCNADEGTFLFNATKPDILIIDVSIVDKSRFDIAHNVCAENPDTLTLFITEDPVVSRQYIESKAQDLCLFGIIDKPLDVRELLRAIEDAITIIKKTVSGQVAQFEEC
jgi:DNA-binding NarL/FixJ family response regulator